MSGVIVVSVWPSVISLVWCSFSSNFLPIHVVFYHPSHFALFLTFMDIIPLVFNCFTSLCLVLSIYLSFFPPPSALLSHVILSLSCNRPSHSLLPRALDSADSSSGQSAGPSMRRSITGPVCSSSRPRPRTRPPSSNSPLLLSPPPHPRGKAAPGA